MLYKLIRDNIKIEDAFVYTIVTKYNYVCIEAARIDYFSSPDFKFFKCQFIEIESKEALDNYEVIVGSDNLEDFLEKLKNLPEIIPEEFI